MPVKGEFEITYFGGPDNPAPCGGVNYSAPYTALPPTDLAPGSVNTQNINGFLCSSPWVAAPPFGFAFAGNEYTIGTFEFSESLSSTGFIYKTMVVVTNIGFYTLGNNSTSQAAQIPQQTLFLLHTWGGGELNSNFLRPGQAVTFVEINGTLYLTGLMFNGIWAYDAFAGLRQATGYVCGRYISELAGRIVVAQCAFPGGGGTGTSPLPTVAWSGVGIFGQAWDGNPAHDVWNPLNQAFFNGNIGGFNLLGDVPDQITGMGTVGQSIIIVRTNGLTQQDPNSTYSNSGIQPYNWYHMWASQQGVGGYDGTVAQWGQALTFRSSDNVYTLSMSAGLTPSGNKIIAKIIANQKAVENAPGDQVPDSFWNFCCIYNLDGQLHYLLTMSSVVANASVTPTTLTTGCLAYDLNMSDGSWHVWDFSQYYQSFHSEETGTFPVQQAKFVGFSCPPTPITPTLLFSASSGGTITHPMFFTIGTFSSYGTFATPAFNGSVFTLVPFDYDFNSNPITTYVALLYPLACVPQSNIVFRGEVLSLGHKISVRRLRIQADNAPMPDAAGQQQAIATFTGETSNAISQPINMNGNIAEGGLSIQTYYGDAVLSDETIQPSLTALLPQSGPPWGALAAFRIASASLIGNDATGTTQ